jgi:hypothetical protein
MRKEKCNEITYTEIRNPIKSISQNQSHEIFTQQKKMFERENYISIGTYACIERVEDCSNKERKQEKLFLEIEKQKRHCAAV